MAQYKIIVAGLGPGSPEDITPAVFDAVQSSDVIVGYKYYFRFIQHALRPDAICIDSGMKAERKRAEEALEYALRGRPSVSSPRAMLASMVWRPSSTR